MALAVAVLLAVTVIPAVLATATVARAQVQAQDNSQEQDQQDKAKIQELRGERKKLALAKASAAAQLDALKLDDDALAEALADLEEYSDHLWATVVAASESIAVAESEAATAGQHADSLVVKINLTRERLRDRAIDVFVQPHANAVDQLAVADLGKSAVKFYLLDQVIGNALEITDDLRSAEAELEGARTRALERVAAAASERDEQEDRLAELEQFQAQTDVLRAEVHARIGEWKSTAAEIEQADRSINMEIRSIEADIARRDRERKLREAEARRRALEELRRQAESRDGPFLLTVWPGRGRITSGFGLRKHPIFRVVRMHSGIDLSGNTGDRVSASRSGRVIVAGWRNGYGNTVVLRHSLGYTTLYAHLSAISVSVGQEVKSGDRVGSLGSTGRSTGPHLHFELRIDGKAVNPRPYLPG